MDGETRRRLREELGKLGFKGDYLDSWPAKVDCWGHKPQLNNTGSEVKPAGRKVPNMPGHPDTAARLSRRGILPWPPSEGCRCKACRERDWANTVKNAEGQLLMKPVATFEVDAAVESVPPPADAAVALRCPEPGCEYVVTAVKSPQGALRFHRLKKHRQAREAVGVGP